MYAGKSRSQVSLEAAFASISFEPAGSCSGGLVCIHSLFSLSFDVYIIADF
jgi:hypothetical protein